MKKISFLILSIILLSLYFSCDTEVVTNTITTTTITKYTIAFNANGGIGFIDYLTCTYNETSKLPSCTFTPPTGKKFGFWDTEIDGNGATYQANEEIKNLTKKNNEIITLYAQWIDNVAHTITYLCDKPISNPNPILFLESEIIILDDVTTDGYIFDGWFDVSNDELIYGWKAATKKDNVTLVAKWSPIKYTIIFNANSGSGLMANLTCFYDVASELPSCAFTPPTGKKFANWNTDINGYKRTYQNNQQIKNMTNTNNEIITLYAQWIDNDRHSITYLCDKPINNPNPPTFLESETIILKDVTTDYYNFEGWYDYWNDNHVYVWDAGSKTGNVILVAKWKPIKYTIILHKNDGSGSTESYVCSYDELFDLTCPFTKSGYGCLGWSTTSNGTVVYNDKTKIKNLTKVENDVINLYAVWINKYIIFNPNGGVGEMSICPLKVTLPDNAFTRQDCEFCGWTTVADGSGSYYPNRASVNLSTPTESITLYAVWGSSGLTYNGGKVSKGYFNGQNLIIPKYSPNGDIVNSIDDYGFYYCSNLLSVEIPNTVENIGSKAFANCRNLISVDISKLNKLTRLNNHTFENSGNLNSVLLPQSIEFIGDYAFTCCNLPEIEIPARVNFIGDHAFAAGARVVKIYAITPPELRDYAFHDNGNLRIYVPSSSCWSYRRTRGWGTYSDYIYSIDD